MAILDALAEYKPADEEQLEFFIESIVPRLQHVNPSIVLSAAKLLVIYMGLLPLDSELPETIKRKLAPPLVTLLSSTPEIQYVALRNIRLVLQLHPDILAQGIRVFFCKYNDPLYIKAEKLQMIVMLANEANVEQIYPELADYAKEVDIDFVRRAIRAIGEVALRIPGTMGMATAILLELAQNDVRYVVQEVLITARDILVSHPDAFGRALPELLRDTGLYDDTESRAALLWLIGEHTEMVPEGLEILAEVLENFRLEPAQVQSELFSAILKLYLKSPRNMRGLIQELIEKGKTSFESAEFRDRAIFYERLIDLDPQMLRSLSLSGAPPAAADTARLDSRLLAALIRHIGTAASVYYQLPEAFVAARPDHRSASESASVADGGTPPMHDLLAMDSDVAFAPMPVPSSSSAFDNQIIIDLLGD